MITIFKQQVQSEDPKLIEQVKDIIYSFEMEDVGDIKLVSDISKVKSLGQLTVIKHLGKGAFGMVSLVEFDGVKYAMKEIDKTQIVKALDGDEERYIIMRDRELLVSKAASVMDNCVKFFTHFEENGKEYYVLELCNAGDLTELK